MQKKVCAAHKIRTSVKKTLNLLGPAQWNALPNSISTMNDFFEFKIKLEECLLTLKTGITL